MPDGPSDPFGQNRQVEVFLAGMEGETPDLPVDYAKLEAAAKDSLSPETYDYVAGSAGEERTVDENRRAFDRWQIVPRMLRDVDERDLSVELFGHETPRPPSASSRASTRTAKMAWPRSSRTSAPTSTGRCSSGRSGRGGAGGAVDSK